MAWGEICLAYGGLINLRRYDLPCIGRFCGSWFCLFVCHVTSEILASFLVFGRFCIGAVCVLAGFVCRYAVAGARCACRLDATGFQKAACKVDAQRIERIGPRCNPSDSRAIDALEQVDLSAQFEFGGGCRRLLSARRRAFGCGELLRRRFFRFGFSSERPFPSARIRYPPSMPIT